MEGTSTVQMDEDDQNATLKAPVFRPNLLPSAAAAPLPGLRPPIASHLQAAQVNRNPPSSFSKLVSSMKEMPPDTAAFLQEQDVELNGDASLLCSLSRVSLSDFLNSEAAEAVQRVDSQYFSTLSSLLAEDPKSRSSSGEDGVAVIVGVDFRHCGYPAFDEAFSLLGFYCRSGSADLRFMPNFYPLPPEMLQELEQSVREWRRDGSLVFTRQTAAAAQGAAMTPSSTIADLKQRVLARTAP